MHDIQNWRVLKTASEKILCMNIPMQSNYGYSADASIVNFGTEFVRIPGSNLLLQRYVHIRVPAARLHDGMSQGMARPVAAVGGLAGGRDPRKARPSQLHGRNDIVASKCFLIAATNELCDDTTVASHARAITP